MIKYYAKQCDPDFTEVDLFWNGKNGLEIMDEVYAENIIIRGNRDYCDYAPERFENLERRIDYFIYDVENGDDGISTNANYYFKKDNGKKWSKRELGQAKKLLIDNYYKEEESMLFILKVITGKEWRKTCICSCSQGDWQYIYVSSEIEDRDVRYIEMCYFNTGVRYDIYESKEDMDNDIPETSYYVDGYKSKERLCEYIGCEMDELEVYEICGSHTYTKYDYKLV